MSEANQVFFSSREFLKCDSEIAANEEMTASESALSMWEKSRQRRDSEGKVTIYNIHI
jgi:hypothetical protein